MNRSLTMDLSELASVRSEVETRSRFVPRRLSFSVFESATTIKIDRVVRPRIMLLQNCVGLDILCY